LSTKITNLGEDHGGDLLGREGVGLAQVLDFDLRVAVVVDNLEGPRLHILLDGWVVEAAADQTPKQEKHCQRIVLLGVQQKDGAPYLTSKTVFFGFIAAWFLAASPIRRSSSVKETNEGVVKLPCSLAMISTLVPSYVATQE
jgi:hypothetical protein